MKKTVVSGIQPSGSLHLGNYFGAIHAWTELQHAREYDSIFFIADLHSLTRDGFTPEQKQQQVRELAIDLLALGINPEACTLFVQSHRPECLELAWQFACVTPVSFLERMTQYKDYKSREKNGGNAGLLTYPILQAADILLYGGQYVPVGRDQVQHLELTNDIVDFFNNRLGRTFSKIEPILTASQRIMSLTDPEEKKMSKSLGEKSYIALSDSPETIAKKIASVPTGTGTEDETPPGANLLLDLMTLCGAPQDAHTFQDAIINKTIRYGELKAHCSEVIAQRFADFRSRRAELARDPATITHILTTGAEKARHIAQETLKKVKAMVGI